jgi:hypothetical protein
LTRSGSYRLAAVALALCSAFALIGTGNAAPAGSPPMSPTTPTPIPLPTMGATPIPSFAPAVLVYPFEVTGELKPQAGLAVAQIFDEQLSAAGGLSVLPSPNGVKRTDYLTNARALKADYYISGYLTPVGDGAALVTQLVSTQGGIMLYTHTAQVFTAQDASSQAFAARQVMFEYSHVGAVSADTTTSSTPAPSASQGASVSLGGIGSLFGLLHHGKTDKTSGAAVAESAKPTRVAIVARVTGTADGGALTEATDALRAALDRYFVTSVSSASLAGGKNASAICGTNRNATIATGTLAQQHVGNFRGHTQSTFTLIVYTCFGAPLYTGDPAAANSVKAAVAAAVDAYQKDHPNNS